MVTVMGCTAAIGNEQLSRVTVYDDVASPVLLTSTTTREGSCTGAMELHKDRVGLHTPADTTCKREQQLKVEARANSEQSNERLASS